MSNDNMANMLQTMTRMRKDIENVGNELKDRYVEAEAGGGLVETVFNGQQDLMKISLDPKLVVPGDDGKVDVELLEDLILAAVTQGLERSRELKKEEMDKVSGGLGGALPGLL
jgi:DNA-binding YbaB/EbfC family protein